MSSASDRVRFGGAGRLVSHCRRQQGSVSNVGRREIHFSSTTYGFYIFYSKHLFHRISFTSVHIFLRRRDGFVAEEYGEWGPDEE